MIDNWTCRRDVVSSYRIKELERNDKPTGRLTLHAPAGGIVTEMHAEEGKCVDGDARLFTIESISRIETEN